MAGPATKQQRRTADLSEADLSLGSHEGRRQPGSISDYLPGQSSIVGQHERNLVSQISFAPLLSGSKSSQIKLSLSLSFALTLTRSLTLFLVQQNHFSSSTTSSSSTSIASLAQCCSRTSAK